MARHTTVYPPEKRLPADVDLAKEEFAAMATVLEDHMDGRTFGGGGGVTVADFVLAYTLDWAKTVRVLDGYPRGDAYLERMYARPRAPMRIPAAFASIRQ